MITDTIGKTVFEIKDSSTPNVVQITRTNSDGTTDFFIPRTLIVRYVIERAQRVLSTLLESAL